MNNFYLYSRDSKDKIRVFTIEVSLNTDGAYEVKRSTGILNGKLVSQPTLTVDKGKAKRTLEEQVELQVNSIIKSQRDKGYKSLDQFIPDGAKVANDDYILIDKFFPSEKTDASGKRKPMLAFDTNKLKGEFDKKGNDKYKLKLTRAFWGSLKLDGVRTMADLENGSLNFKSRTGKPYQGVTTHFKNDSELIEICKKYNCELDGEFYIHGMALEDINGTCAKEEYVPERHDEIQFYLFDLAVEGMDASERCKILNSLTVSNPRVVILKHTHLIGYEECEKYEKEAVEAGYEGVMLRTTEGMYEFGKRSSNLLKLKPFQDAEFTVIGISDGLRPQDMCFIMKTDDGVEFKAKPDGTAEQVIKYAQNIDNLIGKKGTVKFQYITPDGKPFLPKFKCFRND